MIEGIGTDLVDIRRIEKAIKKHGSRFIDRIYTEEEKKAAGKIKTKAKRIAFYAKRYAAKEAYAKAKGKGIGSEISFTDISITNDKLGKPVIKLSGRNNSNIFVSLTDDYPYAQAFVVVSKGK